MKSPEPAIETKAHNLVEINNTVLGLAIKNDFGINITIEEKIIGGYQSQVYRATLDGKTVFIKIDKDPTKIKTEILGHKIFQQKGIPVPDIIAYKETTKTIGHPTMIISAAQGISIDQAGLSLEQEDVIYEKAGKILKTINEIKLEGFGPLKIKDGQLKGSFQSYQEYCTSWYNNVQESINFLLTSGSITKEEAQKLEKIFKEISSLDLQKASLLHRDMHEVHIFVSQGKVSGIIDLGRLLAGDPRYDIAMSLVFQNKRQQEYFKKGYGRLAEDPMVLKYLAIITATKIFFRTRVNQKNSAEEQTKLLRKMLAKML